MPLTEKQTIESGKILKGRILWKIYIIWFFKRILILMALQVALFALAIKLFGKYVFISKVFQNAALISGFSYWDVLSFIYSAFLRTTLLNQLLILIILGITSLLLRDLFRIFITYKAMWIRNRR